MYLMYTETQWSLKHMLNMRLSILLVWDLMSHINLKKEILERLWEFYKGFKLHFVR